MAKRIKRNKNGLINIWKLFDEQFPKGTEVIVFVTDGKIDWGKLDYDESGIRLIREVNSHGPKGNQYRWNEIGFICTDGFPVRKLRGADGSLSAIQAIEESNKAEAIRSALVEENEDSQKNLADLRKRLSGLKRRMSLSPFPKTADEIEEMEKLMPAPIKPISFGSGDPFFVENVYAKLINPGNSGPAFWESPFVETLALQSKDGAVAQLWGLEEIFFVEL